MTLEIRRMFFTEVPASRPEPGPKHFHAAEVHHPGERYEHICFCGFRGSLRDLLEHLEAPPKVTPPKRPLKTAPTADQKEKPHG